MVTDESNPVETVVIVEIVMPSVAGVQVVALTCLTSTLPLISFSTTCTSADARETPKSAASEIMASLRIMFFSHIKPP